MRTLLAKLKEQKQSRAFTLIELIVVVVLLSVLSAIVLPKFVGKSSYSTRAILDDILSTANLARQYALSKTTSSYELVVTSTGYGIQKDSTYLQRPDGDGIFPIVFDDVASGITITPTGQWAYDALGGLDASVQLTILSDELTLRACIATTGYSYEC